MIHVKSPHCVFLIQWLWSMDPNQSNWSQEIARSVLYFLCIASSVMQLGTREVVNVFMDQTNHGPTPAGPIVG